MSEESRERDYIECRSYTHARRHPFVIGVVGGWHLPSPLTPAQLGVLLGSLFTLYLTRSIWGFFGGLNIFIMVGLPLFLTWSIRHMRMEGRAPVRMLIGAVTYLLHPKQGIIHGKSNRETSRIISRNNQVFMMAVPNVPGFTPLVEETTNSEQWRNFNTPKQPQFADAQRVDTQPTAETSDLAMTSVGRYQRRS